MFSYRDLVRLRDLFERADRFDDPYEQAGMVDPAVKAVLHRTVVDLQELNAENGGAEQGEKETLASFGFCAACQVQDISDIFCSDCDEGLHTEMDNVLQFFGVLLDDDHNGPSSEPGPDFQSDAYLERCALLHQAQAKRARDAASSRVPSKRKKA